MLLHIDWIRPRFAIEKCDIDPLWVDVATQYGLDATKPFTVMWNKEGIYDLQDGELRLATYVAAGFQYVHAREVTPRIQPKIIPIGTKLLLNEREVIVQGQSEGWNGRLHITDDKGRTAAFHFTDLTTLDGKPI